jgi:hypothetical protein
MLPNSAVFYTREAVKRLPSVILSQSHLESPLLEVDSIYKVDVYPSWTQMAFNAPSHIIAPHNPCISNAMLIPHHLWPIVMTSSAASFLLNLALRLW